MRNARLGDLAACCVLLLVGVAASAWGMAAKGAAPVTPSPIVLSPVVTSDLRQPLFLTHAGDGSGRLFVVEQVGRVRIYQQGRLLETPFLDVSDLVSFGGERGLLGLAFHPAYRTTGRVFVNYSRESDGATILAEYRVSNNPDLAKPEAKILLVVEQPYGNHNGGMVAFGPDGHLYIGMGDGGAGGDPGDRGQQRQELLGKVLRIDVDGGSPYAIPSDNPFVSGGGRPEIFAYGFRNPWRFSFDRQTGRLWAADVGQNAYEEVSLVRRGGNYGWRIMEGAHCFKPSTGCPTRGLELPAVEYAHSGSRCSITGGYVYRGEEMPGLRGLYVFGDYCSGEIFGVQEAEIAGGGVTAHPSVLLDTDLRISSFGEDERGELYVVDHAGGVYRINTAP